MAHGAKKPSRVPLDHQTAQAQNEENPLIFPLARSSSSTRDRGNKWPGWDQCNSQEIVAYHPYKSATRQVPWVGPRGRLRRSARASGRREVDEMVDVPIFQAGGVRCFVSELGGVVVFRS